MVAIGVPPGQLHTLPLRALDGAEPGATGRRAYRHRPACADSDLGRTVDNRPFEVELLLYDGADREAEEMRVLVCDHLAPCQQLRGGTVKEQLDLHPVARSDAGSFASSPLTIRTVGDELDARSEGERVPQRDSQCLRKRPRERVGDLVADARASVPATASRRSYKLSAPWRDRAARRASGCCYRRGTDSRRGAQYRPAPREDAAGSSGRPARCHRSRLSGAGHSTVRMCWTPLPPCSALHHDRCSTRTRANGTRRSSSRVIVLRRMIGCRRVATCRT